MQDDPQSVPAELAEALTRFRGNMALCDAELSLNYGELAAFVAACQPHLAGERAVGVFGAPGALFGALATACVIDGRPFVHLDPAMPPSVLSNILDELQIGLILTAEAPKPGQLPEGCRVIDGATLLGGPAVDRITPGQVAPQDAIYLVATSGTTGRPKCIPVTQDSAFLSYRWRDAYTPYAAGMRVGIYIFAIWEMFRPLRNGAEMWFPRLDDLLSPQALARFIAAHDLTEMLFTPSFFGKVLQGIDAATGAALPLERVILNGEVVSDRLVAEARAKLPQAVLWNLYSICETHDICMSEMTGEEPAGEGVRVGRAMPHLRAIVLDDHDRLCPPGIPGLLHFEGPRMLGPGYVNRPEETARRFRDLVIEGQALRLYDTGDRGFVDASGEIVVLGRDAHMLKLRGYSIQTRELTETLAGLLGFSHAIPWVQPVGEHDQALVFYFTADADQDRANRENWGIEAGQQRIPAPLASALREVLPAYCIPTWLVRLDAIPIHQVSGKCDYRALPAIVAEPLAEDADAVPALAHAARLLRCPVADLDPARSFHDHGGDSLMCVDLILSLEGAYGRNVDFDWALNLPLQRLHDLLSAEATTVASVFDRPGILLTGVTGFLGRHVLAAALESLPADQVVYCLVRPRNNDPVRRLAAIAEAIGAAPERVVPVPGAIDDPRFGLDGDHYADLAAQVSTVIHCAATVNLAVERVQMQAWSRAGIAHVLDFCRAAGANLRFSSSTAVFPETGGPFAEAPARHFDACTGYGAAKIEAEGLIAASGIPAVLVRLPSLYDLSAPNPKDVYEIILAACRAAGALPEGLAFPMIDVRAAAQFLVRVAPGEGAGFYNLTADTPVTGDVPGYDRLTADDWLKRVDLPEGLARLLTADPQTLRVDAIYETAAAKAAWRQAGLGPFGTLSDGAALLARRLSYQGEPALT
ncbi:AMP-binding protein [uncultured Paracoccus sp.]|uniref:AMP-binding protein n=1 Tax=uncultured Paracoccus sp. TaxID=189685 RepID=UPI00261BADA2|nr:AMP-binding protein [uncultured Paracoccus sp.]